MSSTTAIGILVSRMTADQERSRVISMNIAQNNIEGYTAKTSLFIPTVASSDGVSSVKLANFQRTINTVLQKETVNQHSICNQTRILSDYYQYFNSSFGNKGEQGAFVHDLNRFNNALQSLNNQITPASKNNCVTLASSLTLQMRGMAQSIQELRTQADQAIASSVQEIQDSLKQISSLNAQILNADLGSTSSANLEDLRDVEVFKLAGMIDVSVLVDSNNQVSINTKAGTPLLQGKTIYPVTFSPSSITSPSSNFNPILVNGVNIGPQLQSGSLVSLLNMRDTILPNVQQQIDEFTRNLRDSANAIYNLGTSLQAPSTLIGELSLPGANRAVTTGATQVDGSGVVRLACIDGNGTMQCYKDFDLTAWMTSNMSPNNTVTNLVNAINSAPYTYQNGGATFAVNLNNSGAFQIQSGNPLYGVGIGSVMNQSVPQMSLPGQSVYGFSHFWGMNNLFQTGGDVASSTAQIGIANTLKVNPALTANSNLFSGGSLSNLILPTQFGQGLGSGHHDTGMALLTQLSTASISFLSAGNVPASVISLQDYGNMILSNLVTQGNYTKKEADQQEAVLDDLSSRGYDISGVDLSDELVNMMELSNSQAMTRKCLQILFDMESDLLKLI